MLPSGALLLTNVTQADSGQYSCSATNTYVLASPRFLPSFHNLNVVTGNRDRRPPEFSYRPASEYFVQIGALLNSFYKYLDKGANTCFSDDLLFV